MSFVADTEIFDTDFIIKVTAGEALSARDLCYISTADGKAYKCDADDVTKTDYVGFAVAAAAINTTVSLLGNLHMGGFSLTRNTIYYMSGTPGQITSTPPSNAVAVGVAATTTTLQIFPRLKKTSPSVLTFTSSGTWTKKPGLRYIRVQVQAPGGGGGSSGVSSNGQTGGGGGGGGYSEKIIPESALGSTETVTVSSTGGAGGSGGNGSAGASASFGSHLSATGGGGGQSYSGSGGTGGIGSNGDLNLPGQNGADSITTSSTDGISGGASRLGLGARQTGTTGATGSNYGSGGGGGCRNSGISRDGGPGAGGIIIVTEFY